ncbi:hypothetical protein F5I97DRAFT_1800915 [Phlebopus sp. FC_14]|nr:hypothetical protein F5I97DRAFT_1800915 [Phlebopus sp. FC_14]
MFGIGMGGGPQLKGLNSGWQVWGSTTPKRNASISSAASVNDISPSQGENAYRASIGESWSVPRASSGTWDELNSSPQKKEFSQLDTNSPLSLHHARQRQATVAQVAALAGPRIDDRSSAKTGQFSPQRFDNGLGKDPSVSNRYPPSPSHPAGYGSSAFIGQNGAFDSTQVSSIVENELSLGLRGMAVEEDHVNTQYRQHSASSQSNSVTHHSSTVVRPHPQMVQGRAPYGSYPQADYSSYYSSAAARDPYMDYGYGYSTPADPLLYPSSGINNTSPASIYPSVSPQALHPNASASQQSGMYYDYSASARSPSQYYYPPHQPMMYPTMSSLSPMPTPQLTATSQAGMQDKKQVRSYSASTTALC